MVVETLANAINIKQQECKFMLQRFYLQDKKIKQKKSLDTAQKLLQGKLEQDLKSSNRISEHDYIDLKDIVPSAVRIQFSFSFKTVAFNIFKNLEELIKCNNDYILAKSQEMQFSVKSYL